MANSLTERKVEKRPDHLRLSGRILFLTEDPDLIKKQLAGWDLPWDTKNPAANPKLRDDISTDEITPAHLCFYFDETLGEIPYAGLKCGGVTPIGRSDVKKGGFVCSVSGKRRGKGSSREQSPYAEMCAGIQVVIAENIERIYKQNCQNLGLLTSTNFALIDRIRSGDDISLSEFTTGEDEITRQVIEYGGLFPFNVARMQKKVFLPPIQTSKRPMTLAEKIFATHMLSNGAVGVPAVRPGDTGFTRVDLRFSHEYVTPMAAIFYEQYVGKDVPVNDDSSIRFFRDHLTFLDEVISEEKKKMGLLDLATQLKLKQEDFAKQQGIKLHGELSDRKGSRRNLSLDCAGKLCVAGADECWLRFPYAARRGDRLHRFWHRHHGRFQCVDHQRCARQSAGVGEDRDQRQAPSERHGKRFHPEDSSPGLCAQRQSAGKGHGIRRRSRRGAQRWTSARP